MLINASQCYKVHVFDTPQEVNCYKVESDAASLPVDLTGNLITIEKLVLGGIWTGDLSIFNPDRLTSAPSWQAIMEPDY